MRAGLLAFATLALARAAAASDGAPGPAARPLGAAGMLFEVAARATTFDYAEYGSTGAFLDRDAGVVPQLAAALEVHGGALFLRGAAAFGRAPLDYVGRVQSGSVTTNGLLVRSWSDTRLLEVEGQLGVELPRARGIAAVAGAGSRRWHRDVRDATVISTSGVPVAVRGLSEVYDWTVVHAGLRAPLVRTAEFAWEAEGRVTATVDPTVTVAWSGRSVRLPLGTRTGWRIGTTFRAALGPVLFLRLGFALERLDLGASPRDPGTGLFEPRSETRTASFDLGLGARL